MPRAKKHGGARQSAPGTAHSNRTDMNSALPVQTAPADGRDFGAVSADEQAQQAVPMGGPPGQSMMPIPDTGPAPQPGELTPLNAPGDPSIPVTSGAPIGPGPGSEALRLNPTRRGMNILSRAVEETNDPFLRNLLGGRNDLR